MRKRDSMESGSEEEEDGAEVRRAVASDYEKERLARIAENKARMEALGLGKMASSLTKMMGSSSQAQRQSSKSKKSKAKVEKDDDDYRPEEERPPSSSGEEEEDDEDDDYGNEDGNGDRKSKNKGKAKNQKNKKKMMTAPKSKKKGSARKVSSNSGYIDDDDEALKMAIALSLQESGVAEKTSDVVGANQSQGDSVKNNKRRKTFASRLQMTDDELILHFYQLDENWNGGISVRDLERVANQHDFTWTDKELADMIRCFDSDGDGKISIDDFRKIAMRCKMIKGSEDS